MRVRVTKVTGIAHVKARLGAKAAEAMEDAIDIDLGVATRKMANKAADGAPIETGALKASIRYSTRREGNMTWYFGSWLPYALRQEYEHIPKQGYFRRAYFGGHKPTERELVKTIKRITGG